MEKKEGGSSSRKEEIKEIGPSKALPGWMFWRRHLIIFCCMMWVCFFLVNAYLSYNYADRFSQGPCSLCRELNNVTESCFTMFQVQEVPLKNTWLTPFPFIEFGKKARLLASPCGACAIKQKPEVYQCFSNSFVERKSINEKNNLGVSLNLTELLPLEDAPESS